jgi:predicted dehydrogenase
LVRVTAARFATVTGTEPLRGVVVGAGQLGPYWARELLEHPDVELVGWVDIDAERAAAAADALALEDVPTGSALEDMLDAQRPDFVVNVTAPDAHHAVTIGALDRSVAVLSEKPMAATMAAALDMVAAAERAERLFMVSQNRRYMPELFAFR